MNVFRTTATGLGRFGYLLAALILVFISCAVIMEVFSRAVIGHSIEWVTEISGYLLAAALFMGLGRVYETAGHVNMPIIIEKFGALGQARFLFLADIVVAIFAVILAWQTGKLTLDSFQFNWRSSTSLETPLFIPQGLMFLGSCIFFIEVVNTALTRRLTHTQLEGRP